MGKKGNGKGPRGAPEAAGGAFVLDAGALIAFERSEERIDAFLDEAIEDGDEILIPASALAQVWRGGPRSARLARLIAGSTSDFLDEDRAREIGERLGSRGKADITDAHVVCCALDRDADLVTSDPEYMEALTGPDENLALVSV
jgi:predicted nucleic acid-binding protein